MVVDRRGQVDSQFVGTRLCLPSPSSTTASEFPGCSLPTRRTLTDRLPVGNPCLFSMLPENDWHAYPSFDGPDGRFKGPCGFEPIPGGSVRNVRHLCKGIARCKGLARGCGPLALLDILAARREPSAVERACSFLRSAVAQSVERSAVN